MEKNTKIIIFAFLILIIAIFSFSFNNITGSFSKEITSESIKDITGFAVVTKESACNGACPNECAQRGVSCTSSSCTYVDSVCYSVCMGEPLRTPAYCNSKCGKTGTKYSCSYEETATGNNVALQSKGTSCTCHLKDYDCSSPTYPYYPCTNAIDGVISGTGTWWYVPYTNAGDNYPTNAWIKVNLASEVFVDKIILKSIPVSGSGYIKDGTLTLYDSSGNVVEEKKNIIVPYLTNKEIPVSLSKKIKSAKFDVIQTWGKNAGLAEFEIYESSGPACSDTDNGKIYNQKGTATGYLKSWTTSSTVSDYCTNSESGSMFLSTTGKYLVEYYCGTDGYILLTKYTCANSCNDGTCVEETCSAANCGGCSTKTKCLEQNPSLSICSGKSETQCTGDCEWIESPATAPTGGLGGEVVKDVTGNPIAAGPITTGVCRPKTKCVWTSGHCCGDGKRWSEMYSMCKETASADLCYPPFWPDKKDNAKYTEKQVCWNVGSMAYGFWVPVISY